MTKRSRVSIEGGSPYLPALVLLFVESGCAALIYQIVWLQVLQLVIGSSAISLGVLLGTFMGDMCLGGNPGRGSRHQSCSATVPPNTHRTLVSR